MANSFYQRPICEIFLTVLYFDRIDFEDRQDFDEWMQTVKEKSLFDTGIGPEYDDRFMTVSLTGDARADTAILIIGYAEKHVHENGG